MLDLSKQHTSQEVFNHVTNHLMQQKAKAVKISPVNLNICMYRTPSGLMCAVGCCIPDTDYNPKLEGLSVSDFLKCNQDWYKLTENLKNFVNQHSRLLRSLQNLHDYDYPQNWATGLVGIAENYKLIFDATLFSSALNTPKAKNGAN